MTVAIKFPDGSVRDVPGQLVMRTCEKDRPSSFVQVPVNCDALWRYEQIEGCWVAISRHPNVALLTRTSREWWQSIALMGDQAEKPKAHVA